jgi:simple sugar transport system ATP-binding protein
MQADEIRKSAVELIENFDIRPPSPETSAGSLSGGNQQKVIVARELSRPIKLLVAAQPTRGLDVGSIEYIHNQLIMKRDQGAAVLLVSTELDEIMQLADRIAVMYRGEFIAVLPAEETTKEKVGLLMAGVAPDEAGIQPDQSVPEEEKVSDYD